MGIPIRYKCGFENTKPSFCNVTVTLQTRSLQHEWSFIHVTLTSMYSMDHIWIYLYRCKTTFPFAWWSRSRLFRLCMQFGVDYLDICSSNQFYTTSSVFFVFKIRMVVIFPNVKKLWNNEEILHGYVVTNTTFLN